MLSHVPSPPRLLLREDRLPEAPASYLQSICPPPTTTPRAVTFSSHLSTVLGSPSPSRTPRSPHPLPPPRGGSNLVTPQASSLRGQDRALRCVWWGGGWGWGRAERVAGRGCLLGNQDSRVTAGWTRQRRRTGMLWASLCASLSISRRGALASPSCRRPWVRAPWALASNGLTTRTQNPHCQLSSALGVIPLPSSASLVTLRLPGLVQS